MATYSPQSMHSGPATGKEKVRASPLPEPVRTLSPHGVPGAGQPSTTMMHNHMAMLDGLAQTVAAIHCQTMDLSVWLAVLEQHTSVLKEYIHNTATHWVDCKPWTEATPMLRIWYSVQTSSLWYQTGRVTYILYSS